MTRAEIETALDSGKLWVMVYPRLKRFWRVRRNGRTQLWKKSPDRYSIPCKAGLRECFRVDESPRWNDLLKISDDDPSGKRR